MKLSIKSAMATVGMVVATAAVPALAATINVPADKGTIQGAIDAASSGDTVLVAPGSYHERIDFKGKAITVTSSGGPAATVIDDNFSGAAVTFQTGETLNSVLSGFTIQNSGSNSGAWGGGIQIANSSPTVTDNIITRNIAYGGGGVFIGDGSPLISRNIITANPSGGGIAIYGEGSAQIIENQITDNPRAGGIYLSGGGSVTIRGNVIKGNSGSQGGGIAGVNLGNALIVQNLIVENKGGANTAAGGVTLSVPSNFQGPTLLNNTIVGNQGPQASGVALTGFLSLTTLANNIVAGASGTPAIFCDPGFDPSSPKISHNVGYAGSSAAYAGTCAAQPGLNGNLATDPLLTAAQNGGYYPLTGSPAIDAGESHPSLFTETDLDGVPRKLDGNGDGIATVDIGAYEFDPSAPVAALVSAPPATTTRSDATFGVGGPGIVSYRWALDDNGFGATDTPVNTTFAVAGLADGTHRVRVLGKDAQGREQLLSAATVGTWIVDAAAPTTTLTPVAGSFLSSVSVALSCDDGPIGSGCGETFYCVGTGCTPAVRYLGGPIGVASSSEFRFYSKDQAGNMETVKTESFTVAFPDTTAPVITAFQIPTSFSNRTLPVTLYATDDRELAGYCLTGSNDPSGCIWSKSAPTSIALGAADLQTIYAFVRDAAGNLSTPASVTTRVEKGFIPAQGRVDFVHDSKRQLLYITSGDAVLRYDLGNDKFLSPYRMGGALAGIDISPDGDTLAVADKGYLGIHLVNLNTGAISNASFTPESGEKGSYSVAFGGDGAVLVTTQLAGTGGTVPLRRYDPQNDSYRVIDYIDEYALLSPSAGGKCIAYTVGVYDVASMSITNVDPFLPFANDIGVNRDCSQFAAPTGSGTPIFDSFLTQSTTVGGYAQPQPVEVAYHPGADLVFFAWSGTSEVRAFDTRTFQQTGTYDFLDFAPAQEETAMVPRRMRISSDGTLLFAAVNGGIRVRSIDGTPAAQAQAVSTAENTPVAVTLTATSTYGTALSYQVTTPPLHGTLTGAAPSLLYTPEAGFSGEDSFTFTATAGSQSSQPAAVTIAVRHDVTPPVVEEFVLPELSTSLLVKVTTLRASDDSRVSGYCLSESDQPSGCAWSDTPPASYLFKAPGEVTLYAFARDENGNVSAPVAKKTTITLPDTVAPKVVVLSAPETSSSTTIALTFLATDDVGVTGYCLTENNDPRSCSWSGYEPSSYSFGDNGVHTLFAFAMDRAGNISPPASATITVTGRRNFIPAAGRSDMVYDSVRDIVYITSGDSVLRYRLSTASFLSPYSFNSSVYGSQLLGIDISPDGNTLAIADAHLIGVHLVDLAADSIEQDVVFTPDTGESGGNSVAFGKDGALLVTTQFAGSGLTPLRRVDPQTRSVAIINKPLWSSKVTGMTTLSAAGNGSCIGYAEGNSSDGPFGIYDVLSHKISYEAGFGTGTDGLNSSIAANTDCTQLAVVSDQGTFLYDGLLKVLTKFGKFGSAPAGSAYHPTADTVFLSWPGTAEVRAYDTKTFSHTATYYLDTTFTGGSAGVAKDGRLKLAKDGSILFATVKDGISYQRLAAGPLADDQAVVTRPNTPVTVYLTGNNLDHGVASYRVVTPPSHGTLSGNAPQLVYSPSASFTGRDSFTFAVSDGTSESRVATIEIIISNDSTPPMIESVSIPSPHTSMTIPVTAFNASDNERVAWYCLTEDPTSANCVWTSEPPRSYTFQGPEPLQGMSVSMPLFAFVRDASLNVSAPYAMTAMITIPDTAPPAVAGFSIPSTQVGATIPVTLLAADNVQVYNYCLTESASPQSCNWGGVPTQYTFPKGGDHTLYAFARDGALNVSAGTSRGVTILIPPSFRSGEELSMSVGAAGSFTVLAAGYPVPAITAGGTLPPGITFVDNGNGTATLSGTPAVHSEGSYLLTLTAANGVGSDATQSFTLTVLKARPSLTVSTVSDGAVVSSPHLNVSGRVTSPNGMQSVTVNGSPLTLGADGTFSWPVNLRKGSNSITVVAKDNAGATATETRTVALDGRAPLLTITAPKDGSATSTQFVEVTGTASPDAVVAYAVNDCLQPQSRQCGIPSIANRNGTEFTFTAALTPGLNSIEVAATGPAGTVSQKRTIFYNSAFSLSIDDPESDLKSGSGEYLLKGRVLNNATGVTVRVEFDGTTFTPTVTDGAFQQQLTLPAEKVYPVTVTATDLNNNTVSVKRNITRVWFGDSTGASNGSGEVSLLDALMLLQIADGKKQASPNDLLRMDTAPLSSDGKAEGDGVVDIADVIMALRKSVGLLNW